MKLNIYNYIIRVENTNGTDRCILNAKAAKYVQNNIPMRMGMYLYKSALSCIYIITKHKWFITVLLKIGGKYYGSETE